MAPCYVEELKAALALSEPVALKKRIFHHVVTYAESLDYQGIIHLADFANSKQRVILSKILITLGCVDSTTVSEGTEI